MNRERDIIAQLAHRRDYFVGWAAARLPSRTDAEDVVQLALERAVAATDQLDDVDRAEAWFWTILRRTTSDHLAARDRDAARLERIASLAPETADDPQLDDGVCPCGVEEFEKLSPSLREVMVRVDLQDYTTVEAAADLGISPSAARVRAHRARKELRTRVEERCNVSTLDECLDCAC